MIRSVFSVPTMGGHHRRRRSYRRRYYYYDDRRYYDGQPVGYNGCYDYYDDGNPYYEC